MKALRIETDIRKASPRSPHWRGYITVHLNGDIVGEAIVLPSLATKDEAKFRLRQTLRLIRIAEWSDIIDDYEERIK